MLTPTDLQPPQLRHLPLVQARELWSNDEKKHLRPGHFWTCELGDADGKGSPILHIFTKKNEYFELSNGEKALCPSITVVLLF